MFRSLSLLANCHSLRNYWGFSIPTWDNCWEEGKEDIGRELEDDVLVVDLHGAVEASEEDKQSRAAHLYQGAHSGYLEVH